MPNHPIPLKTGPRKGNVRSDAPEARVSKAAGITTVLPAEQPVLTTSRPEVLCEAALEQLAFLVEVHELKRIVLITHYGCAVYAERLQRKPDDCLPTQMEDLRTVMETLRRRFESVKVEAYLAMRRGAALSFHAQTC